jgi:hypothetical protein
MEMVSYEWICSQKLAITILEKQMHPL